ncbi:MAG TPA: hypothetical protein VF708_06485 [Pyrinomonadaceae bacterium]
MISPLALLATFNDGGEFYDSLPDRQRLAKSDHTVHKLTCRDACIRMSRHGLKVMRDEDKLAFGCPCQYIRVG